MADQKQPDELLSSLKRLVQQYTELNTVILRDSTKILARLIAHPGQAANWQRINSDVLRPSTAAWLQLSQRHVENLLDLGKVMTHRFHSILDKEAPPATGTTVVDTPLSEPGPRGRILLQGQAGATIRASFTLNSAQQSVQGGQFACTPFYHENTGAAPGFQPVFQPSHFTIAPDSALPIEIAVEVPEHLEPALYRSTVVVLGFEQTTFDIILSIEEKPT
ncbi:MAG: hypothetical protein ABIQ93_00355 [Saprospiraceae bacterium]